MTQVHLPSKLNKNQTLRESIADALRTSANLTLTNTTSTGFSGAFEITVDGDCTISGSQTVTLVEDFGMAAMAAVMLLT